MGSHTRTVASSSSGATVADDDDDDTSDNGEDIADATDADNDTEEDEVVVGPKQSRQRIHEVPAKETTSDAKDILISHKESACHRGVRKIYSTWKFKW
ncbi:hypothetical protein HYFRA_00008971 [Hymenoscyphus fraxineus]|uniref:Uncharacterized protein n=1 Tax=Hymenoscyphus fraxineus TaxID=746836 RepID=A0A9N9KVF1_9HELO|nr:hypothetical protein HYFRA_00008971 [Hymenoscyphus fraxineus]